MHTQALQLYLTHQHECGYFADRLSRNLIPDPAVTMTNPLYGQLIQHGFRRSGSQAYAPHCDGCAQCIACRIPVSHFQANRNQRRCLKANLDLRIEITPARLNDEVFSLYKTYLDARHADSSMANPTREEFCQFMLNDWGEIFFLEARKADRLVSVAVTDIVSTGLSAVYTFFDPAESQRSLGTFSILKQIETAHQQQRDYLYMGYWVDGCQKMQYKTNFKPIEFYQPSTHLWKVQD